MANVQGKFYRGETQRPGVTPVSPPNAVDDPQDPLNPPGSGNTTTYKQLGDTTDKDFIGKNGYIPVVVGENALTLQPNIPNTGAAVFGGVVFNSTTTVDIGIVKGYIVDNETDPLVSSVQYIEYAGAIGVTVTTVGSGTRSYGLLKSDGTIHFQNTFPTSEERKEMIYLFKVGHPAGLITVVANEPDFVLSPLQQFRDLFQAFNYVNEGVYPYPDAGDLTFNTSAGIIVGNGINFVADTLNPNTLPVAATVPCTFVYRTQTGAGGTPTTLITPNSYDNAGTITTVGGGSNRSTLQYIHYSPNLGFVIQYGQTIYDSLVEAISAIGKETHVVYENLIRDALLIGVLALTRTTTDLTDTVDARFYRADIFGQLVGSAAGTSVTTLQRAYLNSLIPQIETVSGELVIKNGGALDTDVVFAIRDLLDVDNFTVTGDGDVTANSFIKTGGISSEYLKADGSVSGVSPYILDQVGAVDGDVITWVAANSRYEPVAGGGGGTDANAVHYNVADGKNDAERLQARDNITVTDSTPQNVATTGTIDDLVITSNNLVFTGAGAVTLRSIVFHNDGQEVSITNRTGNLITITNNTGGTAANRFSGGFIVSNNTSIKIKYNSNLGRWFIFDCGFFPDQTGVLVGITTFNPVGFNTNSTSTVAATFQASAGTTWAARFLNDSGVALLEIPRGGLCSFASGTRLGVNRVAGSTVALSSQCVASGFALGLYTSAAANGVFVNNTMDWTSIGGAAYGVTAGGNPTARVDIRGRGTTTGQTLLLEDSAGTDNAIFIDNGQIRFLRLPVAAAGLAAGSLWNNGGVINIV